MPYCCCLTLPAKTGGIGPGSAPGRTPGGDAGHSGLRALSGSMGCEGVVVCVGAGFAVILMSRAVASGVIPAKEPGPITTCIAD